MFLKGLSNLISPIKPFVSEHKGSSRTRIVCGENDNVKACGAHWRLSVETLPLNTGCHSLKFSAEVVSGNASEAAAGIMLEDAEWNTENYVLIPGAVYAGNRFRICKHPYPPPMTGPKPGEDRREIQTIDLPGLRIEGESHLDQLSIDAATPCLAIYFPARKKALVILTAQDTPQGVFNYEVIENAERTQAQILISVPGIRHDREFTVKYHGPTGYATPSNDRTLDLNTGEAIRFECRLHWVDCADLHELYAHVFAHRKDCFENPALKKEIPFSEVFDIIHRKQNQTNWREEWKLYQTSILGTQEPPSPILLFQSGWCGGVIVNYPLLQDGDATSCERVLQNLEFFFSALSPSGLFYPLFDGSRWVGDNFITDPEPEKAFTLTRRVGDVLYFLVRQFMLLRERGQGDRIPPKWENKVRLNADSIVKIWRECGDLGQYIDLNTGIVEVCGSTSGALIPAALVLAGRYFGDSSYTAIAAEIAARYRDDDLKRGLTTGGPGDAMQAPDSESVVALIESFMLLHEESGNDIWLQAAYRSSLQAATWAMSYDYRFPEGSALAVIGAQSRGAWIANAQNKTGVPGICTLSGQGFLRLYRACGDWRILELLREVSHTLPQYMGRKDKHIPCAYSGGNNLDAQLEGWICERVNITRWGEPIGELFAYTTWCEVAMMLVCSDLPGIYAEPDTGRILEIDHVKAEWTDANHTGLRIHNPTAFPANVRLLIEDAKARSQTLPINAAANWQRIKVPAGGTVEIPIG